MPCDLMLVGMNPGAKEDAEGRPFVGPAGRILDEALRAAGLDRSRLFLTNAVKCFGAGRMPARAEIRVCTGLYLQREIAEVRPRLIVALGDLAMRALTDRSGLGAHREQILELKPGLGNPVPVIATFHPSALQHGGYSPRIRGALERDLRAAREWLEGRPSTAPR